MRPPPSLATYRVQLGPGFGLDAVLGIADHLLELGIGTVYLSPVLAARSASTHGYDVVDPTRVDPRIGGDAALERLAGALSQRGLGLLFDIVPNHLAASVESPWWREVLERGPASPHAELFDVDWRSPEPGLAGRVLLPILGSPLEEALARGEVTLRAGGAGLEVEVPGARLPIAPECYAEVLGPELAMAIGIDPEDGGACGARAVAAALGDAAQREAIEQRLAECSAADETGRRARLERLLARQHYALADWRRAAKEIDYRRFFDVSDLVGVRVELPRVFEKTHARILELARSRVAGGLRVDHVDGLCDPRAYLERLRRAVPQETSIVVEKILGPGERLPEDWPVSGTTGYEFAALVEDLYVDARGWRELVLAWRATCGEERACDELAFRAKRELCERELEAELSGLVRRLARVARDEETLPAARGPRDAYRTRLARARWAQDRRRAAAHGPARSFSAGRRLASRISPGVRADLAPEALRGALSALLAAWPVYRTYVAESPPSARDRRVLARALEAVRAHAPETSGPALALFRRAFLRETRARSPSARRATRELVLRFQQSSAPVMAKGFEDTHLYRFTPLCSRCEVGADPGRPPRGLTAFHADLRQRARRSPGSLSASSTHDTKRSEDVRARLSVLSEIVPEWLATLARWRALNARSAREVGGRRVPDAQEEDFLYQSLAGAWPLDPREQAAFPERLRDFAIKAAREAKRRTSWRDPDPDHEAALAGFVLAILDPRENPGFRAEIEQSLAGLCFAGAISSLARVVLKCAAPGIPDFYQGSETWNLALVDPDNRRPVDFEALALDLAGLAVEPEIPTGERLADLRERWRDGRIKLWTTQCSLALRRANEELFARGGYRPLAVGGPARFEVCAFARVLRTSWVIAIVPFRVGRAARTGAWPIGRDLFRSSFVRLPAAAPSGWRSVIDDREIEARGTRLELADAFACLPYALLAGGDARSE